MNGNLPTVLRPAELFRSAWLVVRNDLLSARHACLKEQKMHWPASESRLIIPDKEGEKPMLAGIVGEAYTPYALIGR